MNSEFSGDDKHFMQMALALAEKGKYSCQPNPRVGCVIVQNGQIVGEGYHQIAGQPHAEINALMDAKSRNESVKGATAYVTLEPCSHTGKTPPCAVALYEAGIARVVAATEDPNPQVAGKGLAFLKEQDIGVCVLDDEDIQKQASDLNKAFFHKMLTGKPYVVVKVATTLDGRTADAKGDSKWITGAEARQDVQALRAESCAILTGSGTLKADDPSLNVRLDGVDRQPYRVLLDSQASLKVDHKIVGSDQRLIMFSNVDQIDPDLNSRLADHFVVNKCSEAGLDLSEVIKQLSQLEINQLMIEAGSVLSGAFLEAGYVDEVVQYIAPSILGDQARAAFNFSKPIPFAEKLGYSLQSCEKIGNDVKLVYRK